MELQDLIAAPEATFEKKKAATEEEGEGEAEEDAEEAEEDAPKPKAKKSNDAPKDTGPKRSAEEVARERAEKRAALAEQIAQRGINKILGSFSSSGEGSIVDVLRGGDVGADQDELLAQVSGVGVATEGDSKLRGPAGGKGTGEAADISQLRMKGGDVAVKTGGASERKIKGKVKRKNAAAVDGTGALNPAAVNKVITRKMGAIKGCYERALRRDPNLSGKVVIRFTISGSGRVSAARPVSNELPATVSSCIVSAFKRFRFPQPDGGALTMEMPFLFTPSG